MRFLYVDTETTGFAKSASAPLVEQPHVVQLAALLLDDDSPEERVINALVKPQGWTIHPGAMAVHGITMEKAAADGVLKEAAIMAFSHLCAAADMVVAHNIDFDLKILAFEYRRLNLPNPLPAKQQFCTMRNTTDICRLPGQYGKFKTPKLSEAYRYFFNDDFDNAHDAMADVRACARIHQHLLRCPSNPR